MKVSRYITLSIILMSFSLGALAQTDRDANASARQASRALKNKDYFSASSLSVAALAGNPRKRQAKNAIKILQEALPAYGKLFDNQISSLLNKTQTYNGLSTVLSRKTIMDTYMARRDLNNQLRELDKDILKESKVDVNLLSLYSEEILMSQKKYQEFEDMYVQEEYLSGLELLNKEDKFSCYLAYQHFSNVVNYQDTYEDVQNKLDESFSRAKYKLALVGFENQSGDGGYTEFEQSLYSSIRSTLQRYVARNEYESNIDPRRFVEFTFFEQNYSLSNKTGEEEEIVSVAQQLDVDAVVFGMFYKPYFNIEEEKPKTKEVSRDIKVGTKKQTNSDGKTIDVDVTKKVTGKLTEYRRFYTSYTEGEIFIYDAARRRFVLSNFKTNGRIEYDQHWSFLSGSQDSMSDKDKGRYNVVTETPPKDSLDSAVPTTITYLGNSIASNIYESLKNLFVIQPPN